MTARNPPDLSVLSRVAPGNAGESGAPSPGRKPRGLLAGLVLLAAAGLSMYLAIGVLDRRVEVKVARVLSRGATGVAGDNGGAGWASVQAPGWVEPEPFAVGVPALADGVVKEVLVLEGQEVEAGQVVARMIEDDAVFEVRGAEAMCSEREAELNKAKAGVTRAKSELEAEQAEAAAQRDELETKRNLTNPKSLGESRTRQSEIRLAGQDAKVKAAEAMVVEAEAEVRGAEASLRQAQVMHSIAKLRHERMEIRSPVKGVVLSRLVAPGAHLMLSSMTDMKPEIVKLYDPARLQVRADVALAEAWKVKVGQGAEVSTEALPGKTFKGRVTRIVPEVSLQKNAIQIKVAIENPDSMLKPEMLAKVLLPGGAPETSGAPGGEGAAAEEALFVPLAALHWTDGDRSMLWVYHKESGTASPREVRVGSAPLEGWRQVIEGLRAGDMVLVSAPTGLTETTKLRVKEDDARSGS